MTQSLVPGVNSTHVEKVRLAIAALEAEGKKPTQRAVRDRAEVGASAVTAVMKAVEAGKLPPAADGPWTSAPWAHAAEEKRSAADFRDMRAMAHAFLDALHDEALPIVVARLLELPVGLQRLADHFQIHDVKIPPDVAGPTLKDWLETSRPAEPA